MEDLPHLPSLGAEKLEKQIKKKFAGPTTKPPVKGFPIKGKTDQMGG